MQNFSSISISLQTGIVSLGFFYREPSATGGYYWLPALLGWNLANAGNTKTVENNRNWAMLLLHDVYFIRSQDPQIHNNHGCTTTINWFRRTCNKSKKHYITGYIQWSLCNLQIYWLYISFLFFALLFFPLKPACFISHENPPNKCAKIIRQNDPPEYLAIATCWIHPRE